MQLSSPEYSDGGSMPVSSATARAGGANRSPAYEWEGAPDETRSFALAVIDRSARDWVHWQVTAIPANTTRLEAGASGRSMPLGAHELLNTFGTPGWGGPQPPAGTGPHTYEVTLFALDVADPDVRDDADAADFERALKEHVLASASMVAEMER